LKIKVKHRWAVWPTVAVLTSPQNLLRIFIFSHGAIHLQRFYDSLSLLDLHLDSTTLLGGNIPTTGRLLATNKWRTKIDTHNFFQSRQSILYMWHIQWTILLPLLLLLLLLLLLIIIIIDKEQSYRWMKFGDIKGETESVITAAQDQAISTNYFKKKIQTRHWK
jgi:hypothetical protein